MKRYYVCKIIGDGSDSEPYRPKVADYPVAWVGMVGSNPNGTPRFGWALVLVDTVNHDQLLNDNQIKAIPDATLDSTFGSLNTPTRNAVRNFLNAEGIDTQWIQNGTLIRKIIRYLGQQHAAAFSENNFDVRP